MTITQILGLAIGLLALLLSSELVRSGAARQKRPELNIDVGFRRVGTFGGLANVSPQTSPIASTGSSSRPLVVLFALALFFAIGIAVKITWDKTHPDIRSAYAALTNVASKKASAAGTCRKSIAVWTGGVRHGIRVCQRARAQSHEDALSGCAFRRG